MKHLSLLVALCAICWQIAAQETYPRNGVYDEREGYYAITNATITTAPGKTESNATLVIRDGKVVSVGPASVPKGAVVIDAKGKHIYPAFVEPYSNYGMPKPKAEGERSRSQPQMLSNKSGAYSWNEALKTEFDAASEFTHNKDAAKALRMLGFGTVVAHRWDGLSRGTSVAVSTGDDRENMLIMKQQASHNLSFKKGTSTQNYPSSLMGAISLFRQTYMNAAWYTKTSPEETNLSLEAWNDAQNLPQVFEVRDRLELLRAATLGKEFSKNYIMRGTGDEYMRINEIKATNAKLIVPVYYPDAYDVTDPFDALQADLGDMRHWALAPSNAKRLNEGGITFAFTSSGKKDTKAFWKNIRKAVEAGLDESAALAALTTVPASYYGLDNQVGTLAAGKVASFIITDKSIFEEGVTIHHTWVQGKGYVNSAWKEDVFVEGNYTLRYGSKSSKLEVHGGDKPALKIALDSSKLDVKHSLKGDLITMSFTPDGEDGLVRLSGRVKGNNMNGRGQLANGRWIKWTANITREPLEKKDKKKKDEKVADAAEDDPLDEINVTYPMLAYGWTDKPQQGTYFIKNVTVWTNEADGIIENANVLVKNGKISSVGKSLKAPSGAKTIDGTGKHLTSGIIDEHSHIAISRGVNEGTQYSSAEVRIGDVVNSEDVNIYRQLAGGVTMAQLLHGSANPIGGQSALIKFRYGYQPEEMKYENAPGFIKFALGENVKQSNWGDNYRSRFPQTRMGVEQVFVDHFQRALEYEKSKGSKDFRQDLEMDALLEIVRKQRFITCHSYVQSEIVMLMRVAEMFDFRINTFTHILEGYKVADKMQEHGSAGSTFSDWWAYKYEVIDAIPYNAALMNEQGVLVGINSDDAEMGRRLNQEAGKMVRFGGMSEEDAWKTVTLNPAKILRVDDRVGSIKAGKDADLVLWSDHPLSIYAQSEMTMIDGRIFFDKAKDKQLRDQIREERALLVQMMLDAKKGGAKTRKPKMKHKHHYHCDHVEDELRD